MDGENIQQNQGTNAKNAKKKKMHHMKICTKESRKRRIPHLESRGDLLQCESAKIPDRKRSDTPFVFED
jgi:hypothetical protein